MPVWLILYHWFLFPITHFEGMNLHSVPFVVVIFNGIVVIGGSSRTHLFMIWYHQQIDNILFWLRIEFGVAFLQVRKWILTVLLNFILGKEYNFI